MTLSLFFSTSLGCPIFFVHDKSLPAELAYPFDFGFVPGTEAEDGDPLDIVVLMDEPAFVGAVVPCRIVAAIEAEQVDEKTPEPVRNDRILAVACKCGQVEVLVAAESQPVRKLRVRRAQPLREHDRVVPGNADGRLAAAQADRRRPHRVPGVVPLVSQHGHSDRRRLAEQGRVRAKSATQRKSRPHSALDGTCTHIAEDGVKREIGEWIVSAAVVAPMPPASEITATPAATGYFATLRAA